ncbi:MAG: hypothetical protein JWP75_2952 [Frondihabitans sp.]|nr:hypothetical protein [Frondihabitans sp.]
MFASSRRKLAIFAGAGVVAASTILLVAGAMTGAEAVSPGAEMPSPAPSPRPSAYSPGVRVDPDNPMLDITDDSAIEWAGWEGCGEDCPPPPSR